MKSRLLPGLSALVVSLTIASTFDAGAAENCYRPYYNPLYRPYYNPRLIVPTPVTRAHDCGQDHSTPDRRGIAILSPIESPDHYDPPVGGKTIYTQYYPDYCPHRRHGPRVLVPGNGIGYLGPRGGLGVPGAAPPSAEPGAGPADYGAYAGASKDETALLHLGGESGAERPNPSADLIDLIQSGH